MNNDKLDDHADTLFRSYLATVDSAQNPVTADIRDLWRRALRPGELADDLYDHLHLQRDPTPWPEPE